MPVLDTVAALAVGLSGLSLLWFHCRTRITGALDDAHAVGVSFLWMAVVGLPFWLSATYGYVSVHACRHDQHDGDANIDAGDAMERAERAPLVAVDAGVTDAQ